MFKRFFRTVLEDIREENEKAKKPFFRPDEFIMESSQIAQNLINDLYAADPDHSTFNEAGLLYGHEVVSDWMHHGEYDIAVEHLLYMIHSSDISYPRERMLRLHEYAKEASIRNIYSLVNMVNFDPEKLKWVYNKP